jgi:hypothetical protein
MSAASAPGLRQLQRWFASVTTHPQGVLEGGLNALRSKQLERLVTRGPELSAAERLQIYNDGYFARLVECLTDDYPAVRYALGELDFEALARAYIEKYPSRSRSLNAYGQHMAAFCRARPEVWAAFASDLARLEWALVEVVHEPVSGSLTVEALSTISATDWQTARLLPSRGLRLLAFDYPVNDFFQAFRDDGEPQLPERSPTVTAVYRQGLALWRMGLEPRAALLLKDLLSGVPLGVAVAALESRMSDMNAGEELAQLLPRWLGSWVQGGLFSGVELARG